MIKGLQEVMIFVPDLNQARDWYGELFEIIPVIDTAVYCQFMVGGVELGLHPADEKTSAGPNSTVAYWLVDDLDLTIQKGQELGARLYRGPKTIEGDRKICQLTDPFGNVLGFVEKLPGD